MPGHLRRLQRIDFLVSAVSITVVSGTCRLPNRFSPGRRSGRAGLSTLGDEQARDRNQKYRNT